MEPHPIPQNVTTFEFHLIGDMTLKQFLYLGVGSSIAYLLFVFASAKYPLISWPLILTSALLGTAFAFLPIGSRSLDHWLGAFLRAIYTPTKRIWQKNGQTYKEDPLFQSRFIMYGSGSQSIPEQLQETANIAAPAVLPILTNPASLPTQEELRKTVDLARQAQELQGRIIQTERSLNQIRAQSVHPTPIPVDYSSQVNKILSDLNILVDQASSIRAQLDSVGNVKPPILQHQEKVKVVIPVKPKQTQLALTSFPNVINGIIKDARGNYLESVVVVIYDREGLPVRALKSNKLGQFSGATPLPNGTYRIELEKDGFTFDVLQIELDSHVLPPLVIAAQ